LETNTGVSISYVVLHSVEINLKKKKAALKSPMS